MYFFLRLGNFFRANCVDTVFGGIYTSSKRLKFAACCNIGSKLMNSWNNSKALHSRIVSGSVVLLSGSALTTGLNLLYNVAVARFLGPDGFGQATAVFTLLTLLSAITLSYQMVTAKVVAQQRAVGQGSDPRRIYWSAWACGLIIAAALIVFEHRIADYLHLSNTLLIVLLSIGAAFYVPLGSRRGSVQGEQRFGALATNLVLEGLIRLGGSLILIKLGFGVNGVIAANAVAIAVAYFALTPRRRAASPARLGLGILNREVAQAVVFFAGQMLINNSDIVLVKHFFAPDAAGLYAVVAMVGRVVFALCQAVVNSMVPIVAGSRAEERKSLSLISTALVLVLALGSLMALALRLIPATLWTALFGPGFSMPGPHGIPFLLALYAITSVIYSLSAVLITYEMAYRIAAARWLQLLCSATVIAGIYLFHSSLEQVIVVQLVLVSVLLLLVAIPLLRGSLGRETEPEVAVFPAIRLVRRVIEDEVIAEFLKSDFQKSAYRRFHDRLHSIVYTPDLASAEQNTKRRALFELMHAALWNELPRDTVWYEAELRQEDLERVRVFPRAQWRKLARGDYAIARVAERTQQYPRLGAHVDFFEKISSIRRSLIDEGPEFGSVLLIGTSDTEPLAVIDGNHRFVAAVLESRIGQLRFFCGLSPHMTRCCWYRTSLLTLAYYGRNLLQGFARNSRARLYTLLEAQATNR